MSKKKKIVIIILTVVLVAVIAICSFVYLSEKKTKTIAGEVENVLIAVSIGNEIDMATKSTGDDAKLEKYIKDRLLEVGTEIKDFKQLMKDVKIGDTLRTENIKADLPDLTASTKNTTDAVNNTQKLVEDLKRLMEFDNIISDMQSQGISKNNQRIYKKIMAKPSIEKSVNSLVERYETKLEIYSKLKEIVDFLVTNKEKWEIDSDELKFRDQDKLNEYNSLLDELSVVVNK